MLFTKSLIEDLKKRWISTVAQFLCAYARKLNRDNAWKVARKRKS